MKSHLRLSVLGQVQLSVSDDYASQFATSKVRDLLVYLVLRRGQKCSREEIISKLWEGTSMGSDRNRLSVTAYLLRKMIKSLGIDPLVLRGDRNTLWIDPDKIEVDLWEVESIYAASVNRSKADKKVDYLRILELYKGPINRECTMGWILPWRRETETLLSGPIDWLIRDASDRGDRVGLFQILQAARRADPDSIMVWEALAKYYDQEGDGQHAIEAVKTIAHRFSELGMVMSERMFDLVEGIRAKYLVQDQYGEQNPTLVACLVDTAGRSHLETVCRQFGLESSASGEYVIVKNVVLAQEIAETLIEAIPESRVVLHTVIQPPDRPLPPSMRQWPTAIEKGAVYASTGAFAVLQESKADAVRERPTLREIYRAKA